MDTNIKKLLGELESLGTAQNRKVYGRHGVMEEMYGVSYANLGKLKKRIKVDQKLALQLWDTHNHDARILALMIADPGKADEKLLESWVVELSNYVISDAFSRYAASAPSSRKKMEAWMKSDSEWIARTGYRMLAHFAMEASTEDDGYFEDQLRKIEKTIHTSQNRVRDAKNSALIAIGIRNEKLRKLAQDAAARIGKVEVDHGQTGCKTPAAAPYIDRAWARRKPIQN